MQCGGIQKPLCMTGPHPGNQNCFLPLRTTWSCGMTGMLAFPERMEKLNPTSQLGRCKSLRGALQGEIEET